MSVREKKDKELKAVQVENEELKEVLSDVQVKLESTRTVSLQAMLFYSRLHQTLARSNSRQQAHCIDSNIDILLSASQAKILQSAVLAPVYSIVLHGWP